MSDLLNKINDVFKKLDNNQLDVDVNMENGSIAINGVKFSAEDQINIMKQYSGNPEVRQLMAKLNSAPEVEELKNTISFSTGGFKVDTEKLNKAFGLNLPPNSGDVKVEGIGIDDLINNKGYVFSDNCYTGKCEDKDLEISELRQQVQELKEKNHKLQLRNQGIIPEDDLKLEDFIDAENTGEYIDNDQVQSTIDDLKRVNVPSGSFALTRVGDVIVIKVNDGEGTTYFFTENYSYANVQ